MKLQYILFLLFALFITGLSDGISVVFLALPGIGEIFDFVIEVSINATMGAGLLMLLITHDMYHPKWGPFAIIGGLIPGLDVLPFWVGLVVAGIFYKMQQENNLGGIAGSIVKTAAAFEQGNYLSAAKNAVQATRAARAPRTINSDIAPTPANDNASYVQKAA